MITTIYTIALLAIFTICMIVIFKKTSITSKVNKEKPTHWEVEQLISKIGCLEIQLKELYEKNKAKSKRIAELIELCDKLQPDLVAQHDENINRRFKVNDTEYVIKATDAAFGLLSDIGNLYHSNTFGDKLPDIGKTDVRKLGEDDWFSKLKKGETFYYYYTFENCVMEGSKPMNYKMDGCMYKPRRTREDAEKDKAFYNSQKQK